MGIRMLDYRQVQEKTGESGTALYEKGKLGLFPLEDAKNGKKRLWLETTIDDYIMRNVKAHRAARAK